VRRRGGLELGGVLPQDARRVPGAAGVAGLVARALIRLGGSFVTDAPLAAIAAFCVLLRFHGKLTVLYVVAGCGAIGALLQLTVV